VVGALELVCSYAVLLKINAVIGSALAGSAEPIKADRTMVVAAMN